MSIEIDLSQSVSGAKGIGDAFIALGEALNDPANTTIDYLISCARDCGLELGFITRPSAKEGEQ